MAERSFREDEVRGIQLTRGNMTPFLGVLSKDAAFDAQNGFSLAIGALAPAGEPPKEGGRPHYRPVGAAAFELKRLPDGGEKYASVKWLFVSKKDRRNGVARELMRLVFDAARRLGADFVSVCYFPTQKDRGILSFLKAMGFDFSKTTVPRIQTTVGQLRKELEPIREAYSPRGEGLARVSFREVRARLEEMGGALGWEDMDRLVKAPEAYFDKRVSGVLLEKGEIDRILLVGRKPSGALWVEFFGEYDVDDMESAAGLTLRGLEEAQAAYGPDEEVVIECRHLQGAKLVEAMLPRWVMARAINAVAPIG